MKGGWYRDNYRHSLAARGIDLKRYQGTYRQVSVNKVPWFQRGCNSVTATYKLRPDGKMDVINKCKVDGKPRVARGVARSVSDDNKRLKVSFFPPFEGDYVIKKIDPKYENVTVEGDDTVWKLRRVAMTEKSTMHPHRKGLAGRRVALYTPAYVAADLAPIGIDAVGTVGAAAVGFIPLAVAAGVVYGGATYIKKKYDKTSSR